MKKRMLNTGFTCKNCGKEILPIPKGSFRNHCPFCLYSLHLDHLKPGDRASNCKGLMQPIGIQYQAKKGFQIIHQCVRCGKKQSNIICESLCQPDNQELIFRLMSIVETEKAKRAVAV